MSTTLVATRLEEPDPPKLPSDHSRLPELDGIRAIAIWMVLILHVFYGWVPSNHDFRPIPRFVMLIIGHGWLGVDLFFILSGFLITGILLDSKEKVHYFRNFYARRFLRIMPLYFAVVLVFVICYSHYKSYFVLSTLFAANLADLFHIHTPHGPGVLWSLAIEEHFYLLWPLLVYLLDRSKLAVLAISIIVLTPVARGVAVAHGVSVDAVYNYSWFRFDGLALGAFIALWVRSSYACRRNSIRLAGLLTLLAILITVLGTPFGLMRTESLLGSALRYTQAEFPFASFLLLALTLQGSAVTAILRTPLARISGALSYSIYLTHLAIGDGYQAMVRHFGLQPSAVFGDLGEILVRGVFVVLASFAMALLTRRYLEEPFLRLKRFF